MSPAELFEKKLCRGFFCLSAGVLVLRRVDGENIIVQCYS